MLLPVFECLCLQINVHLIFSIYVNALAGLNNAWKRNLNVYVLA